MAREGREFEKLIAVLEKGLGGADIKITSPDYIEDKATGEKREVDISLKGKIGSHEILVIIECRDRRNKQDVTWIEQIATKKDDIGAHKAIAVSSSGFSDGAKRKAIAKNIEIRTLEEINPEEIIEWFKPTGLIVHNVRYNPLKATIVPHESLNSSQIEELDEFIRSFSGAFRCDTKFIIDPKVDDMLSINDCISRNLYKMCDDFKLYDDFKPSGEKISVKITFIPQSTEVGFFASTPKGSIRMGSIEIVLEIWLEVTESKIVKVSSYKNENTSFAQIISFGDLNIGDTKESYKIEIHRTLKGDMQQIDFCTRKLD